MSKQIIGKVVSTKMEKTVVVELLRERAHPKYKKVVRQTRRFKVHNEDKRVKLGDMVKIVETKPISKEKRWKVVEVIHGTT